MQSGQAADTSSCAGVWLIRAVGACFVSRRSCRARRSGRPSPPGAASRTSQPGRRAQASAQRAGSPCMSNLKAATAAADPGEARLHGAADLRRGRSALAATRPAGRGGSHCGPSMARPHPGFARRGQPERKTPKKTPSPPGHAEKELRLRLIGVSDQGRRHRRHGHGRALLGGPLLGCLARALLGRCLLGGLLRCRLLGGLLGRRLLGGLLGYLPGRLLRGLLGRTLGRLLGGLAGRLLRRLLGYLLLGGLLGGLLGRLLGGLLGRLLGGLLGGLLGYLLGGGLADRLLGGLLGYLLLRDLGGLLGRCLRRLLGDFLLCSFLRGHGMALLVS